MSTSLKTVQFGQTPQSKQAAEGQEKNHAGGFSFTTDDMTRVRRFLVLGSEKSFYQSGAKLSLENAKVIRGFAQKSVAEQKALIDLIVEVSTEGRAPKHQPGLFALALIIASSSSDVVRNYGYLAVPSVARTASSLYTWAGYLRQFKGFAMGAQKAIERWFAAKDVDQLAYQFVKYQQRDGFNGGDLLRLSKRVKSSDRPELNQLFNWMLNRKIDFVDELPKTVLGFEMAKRAETAGDLARIIRDYKLSWEMVPTDSLNNKYVWEALLEGNVPLGALIRQLPRLTRIGIVGPLSPWNKVIADRITDQDALVKARIHPLNILVALKTYSNGEGWSGRDWTPERSIVDALDKAFYLAFKAVEPTGKRILIALDVSGSMSAGIAGLPLQAREAAAALALVTQNVEDNVHIVGFTSGDYYNRRSQRHESVTPLAISANQRLDDVLRYTVNLPFGGTDCAAPILYAMKHGLKVDAFITITDSETWAGDTHPFEALKQYRNKTGIAAKNIVVGTTATNFTIADPSDPLSLDVAGFDTSVPQVMSDFIRG